MLRSPIEFGRLTLRQSAMSHLSDDLYARLQTLEKWNLTEITRYFESEYAAESIPLKKIECHYKAYIALIAMNPEIEFPMGGTLDRYWHIHLLHTMDYARMCEEVSGRFIHHLPRPVGAGARYEPSQSLGSICNALVQIFENIDVAVVDGDEDCSKGCGGKCGNASAGLRIASAQT